MLGYGFNERLAAQAASDPTLHAGRVLSQGKDMYRVAGEQGDMMAAVSGKFRFAAREAADYPAVGDFVLLDRATDENGNGVIHRVLPRKSVFVRKAAGTANAEQVVAANIDTVFLCMSLNNDFNLRRMERYLSIGWNSGALPVVVLTKADLSEDVPARLCEVQSVAVGADVLVTTAMARDGYEQVKRYLSPGQTVAFIGSSGVGKSTLINRLLGAEVLDTNGLRNDDKGRHTTTRRELLLLPDGGMVIDTPGMRELGMWEADEGIDKTFADIEALFARCRFHDCSHTNEPGCAVKRAIGCGELTEERWASYQKLKQEAAYAADAAAYLAQKEQKCKDISKVNKTNKKR
ncbi:MAG: ribosome small subunit-dependent GTPase A [Clostridia bacterium]|nr:ribosome small subunit-dependent GTPase A [Clostridia bacterium]